MKILFLQLWYDFYGGIETVNDTLASQFARDGLDVSVLCLWECGKGEQVVSGVYKKEVVDYEPKRPSYKAILKCLQRGEVKNGFNMFFEAIRCNFSKRNDMKEFTRRLVEIDPDFIIVSNHVLIKLVPKKFLSKCVMHMHSNVSKYIENKKEKHFLLKYQRKIKKVIWLTSNFALEAKKAGIYNSSFINNPVRIKNDISNSLNQKNIVFIGRLSQEKRVALLSKIFINSGLNEDGWNLNIYGTGHSDDILLADGVNLKGGIRDVKEALLDASILALTSSTEGFPMVVLEAYECGVPVIAYDYGVSASEIINDGVTGYIVPFDNEDEYINKLKKLCNDSVSREEMGANAKVFVRNFYPENIVKEWYRLFLGENK